MAGTLHQISEKKKFLLEGIRARNSLAVARAITLVERGDEEAAVFLASLEKNDIPEAMTVGITGTGGAGKSTLTSGLINLLRRRGKRVGVIAVDPSSPVSGGAVLGDRIRMMSHATDPDVVIRSMASRGRLGGLSSAAAGAAAVMKAAGCDPILIETVGVGQAEFDIVRLADLTALILAPGLGDDIQAMKSGLTELADLIVINKGDLTGADVLMRDMESISRDRGCSLLKVSALTGSGLQELAEEMEYRFQKMRNSGQLKNRRTFSQDAEALDAAIEMARKLLQEALDCQSPSLKEKPPVLRARAALNSLLSDGKK